MLVQSPRLAWSFATGGLMAISIGSDHVSSTCSTWFKIWRHVNIIVICWSSVSSKVDMGVVNTFETCGVLEIKIIP